MSTTITTVIVTPDVPRLHTFYRELFGAVEVSSVPDEGPVFYLGLRIGDSELGLVADENAPMADQQRMLISVQVADVDASLERVTALGGHAHGAPNDMPWGQRVAHIEDPDGNSVNLTQQL